MTYRKRVLVTVVTAMGVDSTGSPGTGEVAAIMTTWDWSSGWIQQGGGHSTPLGLATNGRNGRLHKPGLLRTPNLGV